ncbi:MAG TPA: OmpA family protein [Gemmatimonadales bacterium]|nr:OmpA family protein [Gemmatimonadales bacterium]HPF60693.1 OmpA family protein [Gemmatimonadales bacterium]HRX17504.1 OmpA family protein [Gemmatimonadales bacterium]
MFQRPAILCLLLAALVPASASAQIGRVIRRAQDKVENKIERKVDAAIDQAIECAFDDPGCIERAKADGKPVVMTDKSGKVMTNADGEPITDPNEARAQAEAPGTGVWRNYDFARGDSIWVATDWSGERVGRFPASQLEFVSGNMEIVERGGRKLLEVKSTSAIRVPLPGTLPEQFTVEFEMEIGAPHIASAMFTHAHEGGYNAAPGDYLYLYSSPGIYRKASAVSNTQTRALVKTLMPVRLQVDGDYAILYIGADRVAMLPNANFERGNALEFRMNANPDYPAYLANVVVAVGLDPLYDKLMAEGEVTTYGFLFDVDSDRLRPESTPKLEELREMLAGHPDLRLGIEGHTDATGDDAHNADLSVRRARSVVAYLVEHGIAANRLEASGKGETAPIGDNATPAGRQQNRRVVIRKL